MRLGATRLDEDVAPGLDVLPKTPALLAYEARRCTICSARYPAFGFVPPAIPKGEIWACAAHRRQVEDKSVFVGSVDERQG